MTARSLPLAALVLLASIGFAGAQGTTPAAPATGPANPLAQTPAVQSVETPALRSRLREARRACDDSIANERLTRDERRDKIRACVETRVPELAAMRTRGEALRLDRAACREELRGRDLRGPERRDAMRQCLVGKRPELARSFACADEAREKGLRRGERRGFMRACLERRG